jgi:hypothetical protein
MEPMKVTGLAALIAASLVSPGCRGLIDDLAAREVDRESYIVRWELRTPIGHPSLAGTQIDLVTNDSASGTRVQDAVLTDNGFRIYAGTFLIFRDVRRFILLKTAAKTALIYTLDIPKVAKPADWTLWRQADFLDASGQAGWSLMDGNSERLVKQSAQRVPVELRYRVDKDTHSIRDALRKAGT